MAIDREQIIELCRKAGFSKHEGIITGGVSDLERFAALVVAAEREACAKVAEKFEPDEKLDYVTYASTAIRARGQA